MQILVTTFKNVLLIDPQSGKVRTIHSGAGVYYGITWTERHLYIASRFGYKDELGQTEKVAIFNHKLQHKGFLELANEKGAGFHSIQLDPKYNNLWISAPHQNKLIVVNLPSGSRRDVHPNPHKTKHNWNHFNSITIHGDHMMVNAHNGIGDVGHGQVYFCKRTDATTSYVVDMRKATHSHNCFMYNGRLHTCASSTGQILDYEGKPLREGRLKGYTRGIAISDDLLFVGESARAERENRVKADGFVHVYDRWKLNHIKTINLPKCGQVLAIRILDQPDLHHQLPPFLKKPAGFAAVT